MNYLDLALDDVFFISTAYKKSNDLRRDSRNVLVENVISDDNGRDGPVFQKLNSSLKEKTEK